MALELTLTTLLLPHSPCHLLPILLFITLAECRLQKRALRIFSAPPDSDQVYRGLNFPKHIDHVAQGGTIGLEYDARRLAGPVGSVWRRVKKFFRGDYKKDWNNILYNKENKKAIPDKPWGKPWEEPLGGTDKPWEDPVTEVIVKDEDLNVEDRDDDDGDDFVLNLINPRQKNNNLNNIREDDREKEWIHIRGR